MPLFVWLTHWLTALSVAAGFLFWAPQSLWALVAGRGHFSHDFHVSVGIVALALVLARLLRLALLGRPMAYLRGPKTGRTIQLVALILVLSVAVSGYFALRQPALGMKIMFFGVWPIRDIAWMGPASAWRQVHTILSFVLAGILCAHILLGLRKSSVGHRRPLTIMLWPWSNLNSSFRGKTLR